MTQRGWEPRRKRSGPPYALIGILLTLIVVLLIGIALVLTSSIGNPTASPSTAASASAASSIGPSGSPAGSLAVPTAEVTPEPSVEVLPTTSPTFGPTLAPGATPRPALTGFSGPHTASCTAANGVAPAGEIHLTWTATDTTGVRISIDPPAPNVAYSYPFADYPWPAVTSADVPFSCSPPNSDTTGAYHLYVVTTAHTTGYFQYRYMKVYIKP